MRFESVEMVGDGDAMRCDRDMIREFGGTWGLVDGMGEREVPVCALRHNEPDGTWARKTSSADDG
jgi:hypothetical protein